MTVPLYNLTDTWNNAGTNFTALQMNVTNTASGASSLIFDFQLGSVSQASLFTDGALLAAKFAGTIPNYIGGIYDFAITNYGTRGISINAGSGAHMIGTSSVGAGTGWQVNQTDTFSWSASGAGGANSDLILARDAAGILAQRNSTNAQTFRVYNTFTDASNYERGVFDWTTTANTLTIGTQFLGTGSARGINLLSTGALLIRNDTGNFTLTCSAGTMGFSSIGTFTMDAPLAFVGNSTALSTPITAATYSQGAGDVYLTFNTSATNTLTLVSPTGGHTLSFLFVRTIANQAVVSASSNVIPLAGGAAGTAILAATAGKWAMLVADGSAAWQIIAAN